MCSTLPAMIKKRNCSFATCSCRASPSWRSTYYSSEEEKRVFEGRFLPGLCYALVDRCDKLAGLRKRLVITEKKIKKIQRMKIEHDMVLVGRMKPSTIIVEVKRTGQRRILMPAALGREGSEEHELKQNGKDNRKSNEREYSYNKRWTERA